MESPDFWRHLRERFLSLNDPRQLLRAMELPDGRFKLSDSYDEAESKILRSQFVALAQRAAIAADLSNGDDALEAWFRHLKGGPRYRPVEVVHYDGHSVEDLESGWLDALCLSSAEACESLETTAYAALHRDRLTASDNTRTPLSRNLEKLRVECGWTFEMLAEKTGLDRSTVLQHSKGSTPRPQTLKLYALAFSKALGRAFTPADLSSRVL